MAARFLQHDTPGNPRGNPLRREAQAPRQGSRRDELAAPTHAPSRARYLAAAGTMQTPCLWGERGSLIFPLPRLKLGMGSRPEEDLRLTPHRVRRAIPARDHWPKV